MSSGKIFPDDRFRVDGYRVTVEHFQNHWSFRAYDNRGHSWGQAEYYPKDLAAVRNRIIIVAKTKLQRAIHDITFERKRTL